MGARGEDRLRSNERLEFLGDAVLDVVVARELFARYPDRSEGELTQLKSLLVSRPLLERVGRELGVGQALLLSSNEETMGGRGRGSILADSFEAILGAIYLDGGLSPVNRIVVNRLVRHLPTVTQAPDLRNYKSMLLEHVQRGKLGHVHYRTVLEEGPDHDKRFTVEALLDRTGLGKGRGDSKKQAQQEAARAALRSIGVISEPAAADPASPDRSGGSDRGAR